MDRIINKLSVKYFTWQCSIWCQVFYLTDEKLIFERIEKYHLLNIVLYFLVKGYIFTKKWTDAGIKVYSHSTTLILKNLRTPIPKNSHSTTINQPTPYTLSAPKSPTSSRLTTQSPYSQQKISPHKMQGDISPKYQFYKPIIEHK